VASAMLCQKNLMCESRDAARGRVSLAAASCERVRLAGQDEELEMGRWSAGGCQQQHRQQAASGRSANPAYAPAVLSKRDTPSGNTGGYSVAVSSTVNNPLVPAV